MSVVQFPKNSWYLVVETANQYLGSYETTGGDLGACHLRIFNKRAGAYSYTLKLVVRGSETGVALTESEVIQFNNVDNAQLTTDWLGEVLFTFPHYNLISGETYHFSLVSTGYSRLGRPLENTGYMAVNCDWLEPIGIADTAGARMQI